MNGQTLVLAVLSGAVLAAGVAFCPEPTALVVAPDSVQMAVSAYRDSTAECRIVLHRDYGMAATCWARR
jgi:hypothetical protein